MQNHVYPLWHFSILAPILFFQRETSQLYDLKFMQNILQTEKRNLESLKDITLTSLGNMRFRTLAIKMSQQTVESGILSNALAETQLYFFC